MFKATQFKFLMNLFKYSLNIFSTLIYESKFEKKKKKKKPFFASRSKLYGISQYFTSPILNRIEKQKILDSKLKNFTLSELDDDTLNFQRNLLNSLQTNKVLKFYLHGK